jgi:hypothetical protein
MGPFPAPSTVHLDCGYDYQVVREALVERGLLYRWDARLTAGDSDDRLLPDSLTATSMN